MLSTIYMTIAAIAEVLSAVVVVGFGLFLIGLAALILTVPLRAERFLGAFASSALTHYAEQCVRLVIGAAVINSADVMRYPEQFTLFGWVIIISTMGLLLIPWQWHNKFATSVMPPVFRRIRLFALGAGAMGVFILYSVSPALGR